MANVLDDEFNNLLSSAFLTSKADIGKKIIRLERERNGEDTLWKPTSKLSRYSFSP